MNSTINNSCVQAFVCVLCFFFSVLWGPYLGVEWLGPQHHHVKLLKETPNCFPGKTTHPPSLPAVGSNSSTALLTLDFFVVFLIIVTSK